MKSPIVELFAMSTQREATDWRALAESQHCAYLERRCIKVRKSQPEISIGTCTVTHGVKNPRNVVICPHRFLERNQIFLDCLHLLKLHEPGNELHCVSEVGIPGGNVDYFLLSVRDGKVVDFVGIELQALDTTGTLWTARQSFLERDNASEEVSSPYGINWKMTAKTTLVQLHHKIETFEGLGKHLVLVLQDDLLEYMQKEFNFAHIQTAKSGHAMHFHAYNLQQHDTDYRLSLAQRASTDADGIAVSLGLQANTSVELEDLLRALQKKLSAKTRLRLFP